VEIRSLSGDLLKEVPGLTLQDADLQYADLWYADLQDADLQGTNLQGTNLQSADLRGANLRNADLWNANLQNADLRNVDLWNANLRNADLQGANLQDANLEGASLPHFQIASGRLIVWKKVQNKIVTLSVPEKARRTGSLVGRKCRAEYARCLEIEGGEPVTSRGVTYKVGKLIRPDKYDDDPRVECTNGIHFFLTRKEAEEYY